MSKPYESAVDRLSEEQLFELAAAEIADNIVRPGLWAQALAMTEGNEVKAKATYLNLRVQAMKDEALVLAVEKAKEQEKKQEEADLKRRSTKEEAEYTEQTFRRTKKTIESYGFIVKRQPYPKTGFLIIQQVFLGTNSHVELEDGFMLRRFMAILTKAERKRLFVKMHNGLWKITNTLGKALAADLTSLDEVETLIDNWKR